MIYLYIILGIVAALYAIMGYVTFSFAIGSGVPFWKAVQASLLWPFYYNK